MKILLAPLDPVHDAGLKLIKRKLEALGYACVLLPPDITVEEIGEAAIAEQVDMIFVGRTVGYNVEQLFRRLRQVLTVQGIFGKVRVAIGGMAITDEMAKGLGFEAGYGPHTTIQEIHALIERNPELARQVTHPVKNKPVFPFPHDNTVKDATVQRYLDRIVDDILAWTANKSSPGVIRAHITESQLQDVHGSVESYTALPYTRDYLAQCDEAVVDFFQKNICPPSVRQITQNEIDAFNRRIDIAKKHFHPRRLQHGRTKPLVFVQYGTGCPMMDGMHIKVAESWGADGVLHFDPAWGARTEGLMDGFLTNAEDGTPVTYANLSLIKRSLDAATLWTVRAHRGLNTPEIAVLSGFLGADMSKINIVYGSICGGTDPARLTVDGVDAIRIAQRYNMPFDIPTNEELAGVPPQKAFAGMLVMAALGKRLGAQPILKPLLCHGPYVMVNEFMEQNYVDYNFAKIRALQQLCDFPIWPGEPIGFMTHTDEKEQSAGTTALHAAMCSTLGVDAITTASTDEAFSRGPITADGRVGALRAIQEAFRFFGETDVQPTAKADKWQDEIVAGIKQTLKNAAESSSFVDALYNGVFGDKSDGVYPGRAGKNSIQEIKASAVRPAVPPIRHTLAGVR
ncbi:MAG TPA: cobalamin-dependent protein [Candidatus Sulfotelmatobacter sp.]|jgi:methylmalonyl-CoA mutase cobalamin-binding subunit|nr:cobalamin-dependent protein [Candidatus Sulfotelmatobacter sp.]